MPSATRQYIVLAALFVCACLHQGAETWNFLHKLTKSGDVVAEPFSIQVATATIGSGELRGDRVLAIDGYPFTAYEQWIRILESGHPGDHVRLLLSKPSGQAVERVLILASERSQNRSLADILTSTILSIFIPVLAIVLGFSVAFIRPRDGNAWILLLLVLGFGEMARRSTWYGPWPAVTVLWEGGFTVAWPLSMLLFGVYFPTRLDLDRGKPFLKYLLVIPIAVFGIMFWSILLLWLRDINAALNWRPLMLRLYSVSVTASILGVMGFFACLGFRAGTEPGADARRRLKILQAGSRLSLTPTFLLLIYSLLRGRDIFDGVPWIITSITLLFLGLFPLTLAYVIVVERAMDLRFVIRRSLQYGLARGVLYGGRTLLILAAAYLFRSGNGQPGYALTGVGVGLLLLRRRATSHASQWVDRKFFREAYSAEKVLSELAAEVGRYVEVQPLLEKVGSRISDTLHVPDIVILLREGDRLVLRYSTLRSQPIALPLTGEIVKSADRDRQALEIYLDKPPAWLKSLGVEELQALAAMRTQLLLPLLAQGQITGFMSLGAKLSELPYTETDIHLLQAVSSQMGLALENSRLVISLAAEAADRERANTELNIAREVQERLFPQTFPQTTGLDCAGYCRPARGVGGDYYDFLQLSNGSIGIAIGDVSGKGIAAALLMASLQASLRGQTMAGVHDLAMLMSNVNRLVYDASTSNRYATFFYGEYDPVSHRLCFVNAGHNPPVILRGSETIRLEAGGPVVGLLPCAQYLQDRFIFEPGDIFVGYTDGISEAMDEQDEEWDEPRFIDSAERCSAMDAKSMIREIFNAADAFTGSAKQYDDMTLVIVKVNG